LLPAKEGTVGLEVRGIKNPPYGINAPNMNMGGTKQYIGTAKKLRNRLQEGAGKLKDRPFKRSLGLQCLQDKRD
jgi:hypothetical protein